MEGLSNFVSVVATILAGWETVLILAVLLILMAAKFAPLLLKQESDKLSDLLRDQLILWVAQGFGSGCVPWAPGLFGSLVGMVWFLVLVQTDHIGLFFGGTFLGLALSVWLCGAAEKILKQTDPPSVVLDEIAAMPICFTAWVVNAWLRTHALPPPESFFTRQTGVTTLIVFVLFRLFDVIKPPPIRQSQKLPGGWGVTLDDVLAAVCVALLTLLALH
jgi:phosphatidylglycerophosphatase A